jgi:hypothetical protein
MIMRGRSILTAAASGLLVSSLVAFPARSESVPREGSRFSASATGTALYVGALPPDIDRRVAVRAGFSAAAVSGDGRILATYDEFGATVATGRAGRHVEARGQGLDLNGVVVAGSAEAAAPPTPAPVADDARRVEIPDVASVSLGRGEAAPAWGDQPCAGRPLGFGSGRAVGLALPVTAVDLARSDATTELRPAGDAFSVVAEARQGAATFILLPGTPEQTTVELLGDTVLRARADGKPGGAALEYAPVGTDPAAPFVRITRGSDVTELTSQQVFGGGVAVAQTPVMDLRLGEDPRGFDTAGGAPTFVGAEGTAAAGVVDIARVQLLTGGPGEALDVRIGHLEVEVTAPPGGVRCPAPASNMHGLAAVYGHRVRTLDRLLPRRRRKRLAV